MRNLIAIFSPVALSRTIAYMLQNTEYHTRPYLEWLWRTRNFATVMKRRTLNPTKAAQLLRTFVGGGMLLQYLVGALLIHMGAFAGHGTVVVILGFAVLLVAPVIWAHLVVLPLLAGDKFIATPRQKTALKAATERFAEHPGIKIAVVGSYGKTTMKELLVTILGPGKKVVATPGNKNVASSHAHFAKGLTGEEEVVVLEYGEGAPGDIAKLARLSQPTHAVVTGIAPAHLDQYKTLEAAAEDIFSIGQFVPNSHLYFNGESEAVRERVKAENATYDAHGALGWEVATVTSSIEGLSFVLQKGGQKIDLHSNLVGLHLLGPIAFAAAFALEIGCSTADVQAGVSATRPYEHRMSPYHLNGAWVIDDTYNGNIEGIRAGTQLLASLPAKRKLYVTPGLVDQGAEAEKVHIQMGHLIADAQPDKVVLMKNSVTDYIRHGLDEAGFAGEVDVEANPLNFYTNLGHFVAEGDVVLMQNDWTDNYA